MKAKRKRFGNISVGTPFLWDKNQQSLHIKIDNVRAVILDNNSSYHVGTVVTMSEYCLVVIARIEAKL